MNKGRLHNSKINLIVTAACQLFTTILSFITRGLFVRVLSTNYLGVSGLFTSVLTILSLAELGIGNAMIYSLYQPIHDNDTMKISYYMDIFKKAYRIIACCVTVLGLSLMPFLRFFVGSPEGVTESIYIIYLFFLANSIVSYLLAYKRSILYADQKGYVITTVSTITHVLLLVLQYFVLLFTQNYLLYLSSQIIITILTNAVITIYVNKFYKFQKIDYSKIDHKNEKNKIFQNLKSLSISKIAGVVISSADNIITTKIVSLEAVGFASNYTLVTHAISHFISNVISGLTGSIGNLNAENDRGKREKIFYELFTATYITYFIVCSSIFALINPLIEWWLGEKYLFSLSIVATIVLNIYVAGINYPSYVFRTTSGHFKEATKFYVLSAVMNIILSIALGYYWGIAGIYIATSISRLLTSEISDGYYGVKYGACSNPKNYFFKYYLYLIFLVINCVANNFLISQINILGLGGLIIKGIVSVVFSSITCFIIVGHTKGFKDLIAILFNKKKSHACENDG